MTLPAKSAHNKDSDNEQKTESADDSDRKCGLADSGQENGAKNDDEDTNDQDIVRIILLNLPNIILGP